MGYDDRRYYDDEAPRRRGADDDLPRSGQPSRPRNSRPRDDGYGAPPSRSRDDAYSDGYGRQSSRPSRARDDAGSSTRRRDDDAGRSTRRRDDEYGSRAPSDRRASRRDEYDASSSGSRDGGSRSGARDFARRMRDRMTGAYEAFSREVRSLGRRDNRSRQDDYDRSRDEYAARGSRRDDGYARRDDDADRRPPTRNQEWIDDPADDASRAISRTPSRAASKDAAGRSAALATAAAKSARSRSLALQMINRRRKLRVGKVSPGARALTSTVLALLAVLIIVGGGLGVGYAYAKDAQYATVIAALGESRDLQSSRIYDRHGQLLYQTFGQQNSTRDYLDFCDIPPLMQQATIDTEDHTFWSNSGVDINSIFRALSADVLHNAGTGTQGGSTITQQLVKLAVLRDASQNVLRKVDEAILAMNLTQHYSKQNIITMYLNIVPYGFIYEGIEAAAENYFHLQPIKLTDKAASANPVIRDQVSSFVKYYTQCMHDQGLPLPKTITMSGAWQLQPWQATLLAGVPNNPNVYNPWAAPQLALNRQYGGVLVSMHNYGDDQDLYQYNADGSKTLLNKDQMSAYTAQMLNEKDPVCEKAHKPNCPPANIWPNKYQGPNGTGTAQKLAPYFVDYVINQISQVYPGGEEAFATAGLNVYTTLDYGTPVSNAQLSRIYIDPSSGKLMAHNYDPKKEGNWLDGVGLEQYAEYVVKRNITQDFPDSWYCTLTGLSHVDYSQPYDGNPADNPFSDNQPSCWETPLNNPYTNVNDGALTAIDPRNGDILAMVGGVDYNGTGNTTVDGGQNNVVTSPFRSMGSSFKPIVYATAIEMGWNPGTIIYDQPTCFPTASSAEAQPYDAVLCPGHYLPHNDENWHWIGPQPLHELLSNSLNTPAEETLSFVGMRTNADTLNMSPLIPMAERLGITSLKASAMGYSTAIGTQAVPLLQLTSAYGTFANHGYRYPPRAILSIVRADGVVRMAYQAQPQDGYQAISAQAAFMVTSMLDDNTSRVADFGPDNPLHFYGRDVAAKTGTSDAEKDIVTMGYTPWLAMGVWSGNADSSSMDHIIGIAGAGYIFHDVMAYAIARYDMPGQLPSRFAPARSGGYFPVPSGVHLAALNCHTGLAPYKGMNPLDPKKQCDPTDQDRVPLQMTPEFWSGCAALKTQYPPYNPNEYYHCGDGEWGPKLAPKITDSWEPTDWGHLKHNVMYPGLDIAWVMDGQDPTVP